MCNHALWCSAAFVLAMVLWCSAGAADWPPPTSDALDPTPKAVPWVEPKPLRLPSDEALETIAVRDKTYHITQTSAEAEKHARAARTPDAFARHEKLNEALYFRGSGAGGKQSRQRLIVENCTFILDFQEGDFESFQPLRSAIYVDGYNEVLVRNCVFLSKSRASDPLRKTTASIYAADCVNVQVENCYFEGRTIGWRGHINIWGCGPTSIANCEINARGGAAGGIWVATGVGEGKIGFPHDNGDQSLAIYPPGPLRIEHCDLYQQRGKENSDGIYVQSVRPYLIRNCRVVGWGDDSLFDVGFRDTSKKWRDKFLINHGGLGVIEQCEFADGWMKTSVGLGGGLVFRNNVARNAWFFPYAFDGGSWYVVGNRFEALPRVLLSGRNGMTDGWTPAEGMFAQGGKMLLYNNHIRGEKPAALFVAGSPRGPVTQTVASDYNVYDLQTPPTESWAIEHDQGKLTLDAWRKQTGNDAHSLVGRGGLEAFKEVDPNRVKLPGGLAMTFGPPATTGLVGPVGVSADVRARAKPFSQAFDAELEAEQFVVQPEAVLAGQTMGVRKESRAWAAGGAYLALSAKAAGESVSFRVPVKHAGRYYLSVIAAGAGEGRVQLQVDDKPVGEPFTLAKRGGVRVGAVDLPAGERTFTLSAVDGSFKALLDELSFREAGAVDRDAAREKAAAEVRAKAAAARAEIEARKLKFPIADLTIAGKPGGRLFDAEHKGSRYRLWQAGAGDAVAFNVDIATAGEHTVYLQTVNQSDAGAVQLVVDGQAVGEALPLAGSVKFAAVELTRGPHAIGLKLVEPATARDLKVRLGRLDLLPPGEKAP